ncbi:MAG: signal recognition particle receptor FtsY [Planctomycetota bacterium]|nr:MAG: signal recognition particle receptor FtsY [Planctomycetota bacterium]
MLICAPPALLLPPPGSSELGRHALAVALLVLLALLAAWWWRSRRARPAPGAGGAAPSSGAPSALQQLARGLHKTRARLGLALRRALGQEPSEQTLEELEVALLEADLGVATSEAILEDLRRAWRAGEARSTEALLARLKDDLSRELVAAGNGARLAEAPVPPTVVLVVGVNGVGKTTSIAKLAHHLRQQGRRVLLAAADTFRAAAVDQLRVWSERLGVPIVAAQTGADPAAVVHDALEAAIARGVDYLIVDTAGRLHTHQNLMKELEKIKRVIRKRLPEAPHEVLLVLDATTGQNAIAQARAFREVTEVTGIFLAKLDGTAKGGIVVAIARELGLPVKFVGLGEKPEDVQPFEPRRFVEALFAA